MKQKLLSFLFLTFVCCSLYAQVSNETMKQINSLLKEKNSRSPQQKKIDSHLLQALRESRGEKMAEGVSLEPAKVNADFVGNLKVDISADITDAFISKLQSLGAKIIYPSAQYHTVRALVNLSMVEKIAAYPEVKFIEPAVQSMLVDINGKTNTTSAERIAKVRDKLIAILKQQNETIGSVTSQGDATHRAAQTRTDFGFLGAGIKIGVLSDSYNALGKASSDVTKGDLPGTGNPDGYTTPVTVVQDYSGGADEGRAMLQVIHDLAPAAQLYFATADISEAGFASNILALRNTYGCNIIIDDVAYFDEPAFQDGITAQAVNTVTASGALYFSSAGNSGSLAKGTSGVFEGDFNDAGSKAFTGSSKGGTIHNFGTVASPVNGDIIKSAGEGIYNLNWSDAWGASGNDYDLFLVSSSGTVKSSSTNSQTGTQNPYESLSASISSGDRLVVFKTTAAAVRALHLNTNRGTLTVATNGQTTGHACAVAAFCMAATPAATKFSTGYPTGPYPNAFNSSNLAEPFSSDGPRKMFYNGDGSAITAGNFTFASGGGTTLAKPDLTAADGVSTTLAASSGLNPFFGTSCAAPHAGAIAALLLSANPSLTPSQIRSILTSTALDIEAAGYDNVAGFGIVQAYQAMQAVAGTSVCSVPSGETSTNITTTGATVSWGAVSGGNSYDVDYKIHTATSWTNAATATTAVTVNLSGLSSATLYDWRVRTNCASTSSAYDTTQFTTATGTACNSQYDGSTHNTFASAVAIPLNTDVHGTISTASDADYYSFTISKRGTATVNLTTLPADYDLYIYKSTQAAAGKSKNTGTTSEAVSKTFAKGTFYVKVISKSGAFNASTCYTLNVTTGTASLSSPVANNMNNTASNTFTVFPNPVHSMLNVSNAKMSAGSIIRISDVYGKAVIEKQAASSTQQIDVSKLSAGIYMISIIGKDGRITTSKFVKQ